MEQFQPSNRLGTSKKINWKKQFVHFIHSFIFKCANSVSDSECQAALESAIKVYIDGGQVVSQKFPLDNDEMQEDHENLTELAVAEYQKRALGDMMTKYREKLEERMNEEYIKLCRKNDEVSEKKCRALLEQLFQDIDGPLKARKYSSSSDLLADFKSLNAKYLAAAKGRFKWIGKSSEEWKFFFCE